MLCKSYCNWLRRHCKDGVPPGDALLLPHSFSVKHKQFRLIANWDMLPKLPASDVPEDPFDRKPSAAAPWTCHCANESLP